MQAFDELVALGVGLGFEDLREELIRGQVEHLPQCESDRFTPLGTNVQTHQSVTKKASHTEACVGGHDLFLQWHIGHDATSTGFGDGEVQTDQDAVLTIARPNPRDLSFKATAGNEVEAVDAAGDEEHTRQLTVGVAYTPSGFRLHDAWVTAIQDHGTRLEKCRLNNVARALGDVFARPAFRELLFSGGIQNGTHRKSQSLVNFVVQATDGLVKGGNQI